MTASQASATASAVQRDGHRLGAELDRRGHRQGGDAGPDGEEPEQVALAIANEEMSRRHPAWARATSTRKVPR